MPSEMCDEIPMRSRSKSSLSLVQNGFENSAIIDAGLAPARPTGSRVAAIDAWPGAYIQKFAVEYNYPVCFTRDLFDPRNPLFAELLARMESDRRHRFFAVIDDGLANTGLNLPERICGYADAYASRIELISPPEFIPGGERCKNDAELVVRLQQRLVDVGIDRHSFVVAVGGGAALDLVGFVAATVHRGVRLIRVPTTVLAQNDSGVGVKNGVNSFGIKNLLGVFAPPFAVVNDAKFLDALEDRDKIAGMAEAVKVALIRDRAFFDWLEANAGGLRAFRADALDHLVRRCAELHMVQIAKGGDPFERGSARPLDYGHWSAHKLETLTGHALRHGEAVAIGIALDARYSVLCGHLAHGHDRRICDLLRALGLPVWHSALETAEPSGEVTILRGLREFREHLGGELTITLLSEIGRGVEVHKMDEELILASIEWLKTGACR
jgi:3-dehydroquinate synthase